MNTNWWNFPNASAITFGQQEWDNNNLLLQTNNNGGNTLNTWRWVFRGNANQAHTFSGDAVRFFDSGGADPQIENQSTATHIINMNISGDGDAADPFSILIQTNGGLTFNGTVNNQGATINVQGNTGSAATVTFGGVMSGTGGFYKENANITVLMTAANTYNGQTTIQSGTLRLAGSGSLANSAVRLHSGATLSISNNATVGSVAEFASGNAGVIAISNGATLTINSIETGLFQNSISGAGNLNFSGTGSLSLYGSQSYTGTTTVSNGQLSTGVAMSSTNYNITGGTFRTTADSVIDNSAAVTLGGGTFSFGGNEGFGQNGVALTSSTSSTIAVDGGKTATALGVVSGSGNFSKTGGGQLNLTGASTYTGATTVSAGSLELQNANALGSTGAGTTVNTGAELRLWNSSGITYAAEGLSLNGAGINNGGALRNITNNNVWQGNITYGSGARINSDSGTLTISGTLSGGTNNMYFGGAGNVTLSNTIAGNQTSGDGAIYKDGSGTLTLSSANNSLTGLVRILGGTLSIGAANNTGTGTVEIGGTGTLSTTASLTRTAGLTVTDASGGAVIDVASGATFTQNGAFTGAPTASTKIGKSGAGDLIFNAASGSTYGGQIQIGQGRVIAGTTGALGTNASTVNRGIDLGLNVGDVSQANNVALLASNGVTVGQSIFVDGNTGGASRTIGLSGSGSATFSNEIFLGGNLTVNAGAAGTDQVTISGAIVNTNGVTKTGSGSLLLSGANTYTGQTTVSGGTLVLTNGSALADTAVLQLDNTAGASATVAQSETIGSLRGGGATGGNVSVANGATLTVAETTTQNYAGAISGNGALTKSGTGQLNLSGANSYSGLTTISSGSVEAQSASALGSTNGATTVNSGANLKLYGGGAGISYDAEAITLNGFGPAYGDVGGDAGALRSVGGGTNTWNGAITLGSSARINSDAAGGAGLLTIAGNINGGANVLFVGTKSSAVANMTISGALSGAGALQDNTTTSLFKDGASTLTLAGNNSYSGDTRINGGNLTVASGGNLGSGSDVFIASGASLSVNANTTVASVQEWGTTNGGTISLGSGANLTVNGANKGTMYQNSISGDGSLTMNGSGNSLLSLYGAQTYTGTTTVSGGEISTQFASSLASTNITVNGGTLNTGGANKLADAATVAVSSGTLGIGGSDTVGSVAISSSGTVNVAANSTLTTTADSTISGTGKATGGTLAVTSGANLNLANNASTTSSDFSIGSGSLLSGTGGTTGKISGQGTVGPGNSPGILTASQVDLNGRLDFQFEFGKSGAPDYANPAASGNDLLRLTNGSAPFIGSFDANNIVSLFFRDPGLSTNLLNGNPTTYLGGFFVDASNFDFVALLNTATMRYYVIDTDSVFDFSLDGINYSLANSDITNRVILKNENQTANFGSGNVNGTVLSVTMVPEPSSASLLTFALSGLLALRRRRKA